MWRAGSYVGVPPRIPGALCWTKTAPELIWGAGASRRSWRTAAAAWWRGTVHRPRVVGRLRRPKLAPLGRTPNRSRQHGRDTASTRAGRRPRSCARVPSYGCGRHGACPTLGAMIYTGPGQVGVWARPKLEVKALLPGLALLFSGTRSGLRAPHVGKCLPACFRAGGRHEPNAVLE